MKNRQILKSIIKTVVFCGQQGISLRGYIDFGPLLVQEIPPHNEGNFRAILRMRIDVGDETLKDHLQFGGKNKMYISWSTQNEIISSINTLILRDIVKRVNNSACFSVLADETIDISGIEQFSLALRFIENDKVHEQFLQFIPVVSTTGASLSVHLINSLKFYGVDLNFLRGQGYDGARAMSVEFQGVQVHIKKDYPLALYVHCSSHCFNLAISDSCNIPEIRSCIGVVGQIYEFFYTPKRQHVLKTNIGKFCSDSKKQKLIQMCATKWAKRYDSVIVFVELFEAIQPSLEEIVHWNDKDSSLQTSVLNVAFSKAEFLISRLTISRFFSITKIYTLLI